MFDLHDIAVFREYLRSLKDQLKKTEAQSDALRSMIYEMDETLMDQEDRILDDMYKHMTIHEDELIDSMFKEMCK